jgi:putative membrane protein
LLACGLAAAPPACAHAVADKARAAHGIAAIVLGLVVVMALAAYLIGARRLHRRAGRRGITTARALAFAGGTAMLLTALWSPLDTLAAGSFALHMVQHELLMLVAAPLLVLGRPLAAWSWALPARVAHRIRAIFFRPPFRLSWRALTGVTGATALQIAVLWLWHMPSAFDAALASPLVHLAQHASFLAVALCFWWATLGSPEARHGIGASMAALFTTMLTSGALGALLSLSVSPWYTHDAGESLLGLTLLEEQQLGGMIMWIPGGVAYLVGALACSRRLLVPRRAVAPVDLAPVEIR